VRANIAYYSRKAHSTVTREVSAIVLVRNPAGWRIVAQAWEMETGANRIPDELRR